MLFGIPGFLWIACTAVGAVVSILVYDAMIAPRLRREARQALLDEMRKAGIAQPDTEGERRRR